MRAASIRELPVRSDRDLVYEPKWDGWRCIARVGTDRVQLHSRHGTDLTRYFPDLVQPLRTHLPPGVTLDGELIIWDPGRGCTSFTALQRRISAGRTVASQAAEHPAHLVVFDLLTDTGGEELVDQPLVDRRGRLEQLCAEGPAQLLLCPQTRDVDQARTWMREWTAAGIEGLVIKDSAGRYRPGRADWQKFKTRMTAEAVIGGITGTTAHPYTLLLGRVDTAGHLRYVGQTHPLTIRQRRELAGTLAPLALPDGDLGHPWPQPLPAAWSGQFDQRQPQAYIPIRPTLVVEVETDTASEYGRWRHRVRYLRSRPDLHPSHLPLWLAGKLAA